MKIYLAPLENITTIEYRNTLHEFFGDSIDRYYMPFFMPHIKISLDEKDRRQLDRERNKVSCLIPQIITDRAEDFRRMAEGIIQMGYTEINLNIGCPSKRVASKGRGAGLLRRKEYLDHFLCELYEGNNIDVSVKTRLGMYEAEEFYELLEIYNKYPIKELTIHARTGVEKYSGRPHKEYFLYALKHSKNPVSYNGDIVTVEDYHDLMSMIEEHCPAETYSQERMPGLMIGRGLLANPALAREIKGGPPLRGQEMLAFMNRYRQVCSLYPRKKQEEYLMNKSKEMLGFSRVIYPDRLEEMKEMFLCQDYGRYLKLEEDFYQALD